MNFKRKDEKSSSSQSTSHKKQEKTHAVRNEGKRGKATTAKPSSSLAYSKQSTEKSHSQKATQRSTEQRQSNDSRNKGKLSHLSKEQKQPSRPVKQQQSEMVNSERKKQRSHYPNSKVNSQYKTSNGTSKGNVRHASAEDITVGDRIVVTIKRIGINGEGVGYYKRKAVFIDHAITDEVVKAKVTKVEKSFLQAELIEVEKMSPYRQEAPCPVYEECGGCQLQHMTYEAQLRSKEEIVKEAFSRYANMNELPLRPIIGMDEPWHYRNKAQLQVGQQQGEIITGLYAAGSHRLIDISDCSVQEQSLNDVYKKLKSIVQELKIPHYDERTRQGVLKTIVVRMAKKTGKLQLTFVTATDRIPDSKALVNSIRQALPHVSSIAHNVHKEKSSVVFGPKTTILWGEDRLDETLGDIQFSLSPRAFFQLNPEQTVKLYDAAKEAAALTGKELVVDAYCGTGTIGLWLANDAKEVRGVEVIAEAVQDARANAKYSGIDNALFYEGYAEKLLPQWVSQGFKPDVIVVDPPRTGLDASLINAVLEAKPQRFVYVSCNPSTLAKDCKELVAGGYKLEWIQPVDMFPQTAHVECCLLLVWNGKDKN